MPHSVPITLTRTRTIHMATTLKEAAKHYQYTAPASATRILDVEALNRMADKLKDLATKHWQKPATHKIRAAWPLETFTAMYAAEEWGYLVNDYVREVFRSDIMPHLETWIRTYHPTREHAS